VNLDLSKFKKLESNDKCTTLAHPSGHKIKISHKSLSPDMQKQIEGMPAHFAKGGKVSKPSKSSTTMPGSPTEAKDAFTEPDDGGTDVVLAALNKTAPPFGPLGDEPTQKYPPCINPSCKSFGHSHPNCRCYGGLSEHTGAGEAGYFAKGGEVEKEYYCDNNRPHFKGCEYFADGGDVSDSQKLAEEKDLAMQRDLDPTAQNYGSEVIPPSSPSANQMASFQPQQDLSPNPEMQGREPASEAEPEPQKNPMAGAPGFNKNYQEPERDPYVDYQQNITNNMLTHAQNYQADLDSQNIQPKHYFHLFSDGDGTLGKIGSVFGLMLSGIGSGLTGQPNAALHIMDQEIQNDMKRQQNDISNKQNFLKINQEGLANDANVRKVNMDVASGAKLLALSNQRRSALHYLVDKTQRMPESSPLQKQQKQAAYQTLGMMNDQIQKEDNDMFTKFGAAQAAQKMIFGGGGSEGNGQPNTTLMKSGMMGQAMQNVGQDLEEKTINNVPSVAGQRAARPIPQDKRDQVQQMNVLDDKAKDLMDYAKVHEGSWNPKTRAVAQQKANEMVGFYSSSLGTSMTQGNRTWLDEQIAKKNPTSIIAQELYGSSAKLKEIQDSNNMRRNNMLKSLGFNPKESKSDSGKSSGPQSKSGKPMIQKDGKWYYK
jgi:hypothetical protein